MLQIDDNGLPLEPEVTEGPEFEAWLEEMVDHFISFRDEFFEVAPGRPWLTDPFHREWISGILRAIYTGGKQLILSPPRHGKSELLVHFCVWSICRNPNIRIMWVGKNGDLAGDMLGATRLHLDTNTKLISAVLPPHTVFDPGTRSGVRYSNTQFTVSTRTIVSPSPTMVAVGRSGTILSRTCDLIVSDDLEDKRSTEEVGTRGRTRKWFFTDLDSRHEETTGWVTIGSRQHPDDLYSYLLNDPDWETIVNSAHSPQCDKPLDEQAIHTDCMLFPELRTFRWLMKKRNAAAGLNEEGLYEMVYLNMPRPEGTMVFTREGIEGAYNFRRNLGVPELRDDDGDLRPLRVIAGLDPSATGYQAAFCWAWDPTPDKLYMVDIDNHLGGGIAEALRVFEEWRVLHGVTHWVIEENGFQKAIRLDPRVRAWSGAHEVTLEGHETYSNKFDRLYGVGSMQALYPNKVDLPYGDERAKQKTQLYTHQLLAFSEETGRSRTKSDVLMSSWFPTKTIRRWRKERQAEMSIDYTPSYTGVEESHFGEIDQAPWS